MRTRDVDLAPYLKSYDFICARVCVVLARRNGSSMSRMRGRWRARARWRTRCFIPPLELVLVARLELREGPLGRANWRASGSAPFDDMPWRALDRTDVLDYGEPWKSV